MKNWAVSLQSLEIDEGSLLQAHSSVEKAGLIGLVKLRYIESDDNLALRGDKLKEAIKRDRDNGLIPFYVMTPVHQPCCLN